MIEHGDHEGIEGGIGVLLADLVDDARGGSGAERIQFEEPVAALLESGSEFEPGDAGLGDEFIEIASGGLGAFVEFEGEVGDAGAEPFEERAAALEVLFEGIQAFVVPAEQALLCGAGVAFNAQAQSPNLVGFWYKPAESGWGLSIQQQGTRTFAVWFTYNAQAKPVWYTLDCSFAGNTCAGSIATATGTPLAQMTGGANFNEVFFTNVRIPDSQRLGKIGQGWQVALTTLMNERVAVGERQGVDVAELLDLAKGVQINGRPAIEDGAVRA